jgi:peroxiredoxin
VVACTSDNRQLPTSAFVMTEPEKIWRNGNLAIVLFLAVPGVFVFLEHLGYFPGETARQAIESDGRTFLAPDFSLPDSHGDIQRLSAFRGRVVLLNFWATWCPPCRADMPTLENFYQAHRDRGLTVLAVSSDQQGRAVVAPFLMEYGLSFTALLDLAGEVTRMYGVSSLPTTYLLDRQGRLVTVAIGGSLWTDTESQELIAALLDGGASPLVEDHTTTARGSSEEAEAGVEHRAR